MNNATPTMTAMATIAAINRWPLIMNGAERDARNVDQRRPSKR